MLWCFGHDNLREYALPYIIIPLTKINATSTIAVNIADDLIQQLGHPKLSFQNFENSIGLKGLKKQQQNVGISHIRRCKWSIRKVDWNQKTLTYPSLRRKSDILIGHIGKFRTQLAPRFRSIWHWWTKLNEQTLTLSFYQTSLYFNQNSVSHFNLKSP